MSSHAHGFTEADWPFEDPVNVAAITTRAVMADGHPILLVTHDADEGDWQLLCGTTNDPGDGRMVCLGCLFEKDPTIGALADLPLGWRAWRDTADSPWQRGPAEDDGEDDHEDDHDCEGGQAKLLDDIARVGWQVVGIGEEQGTPGWAFTVGLGHSFGQPEVIVFGLPIPVMFAVLNSIGEAARGGAQLVDALRMDELLEGYTCELRTVHACWYEPLVGTAQGFYRERPFSVLQLLWPDRAGRLPTQDGFDEALRAKQPLLMHSDAELAGMSAILASME